MIGGMIHETGQKNRKEASELFTHAGNGHRPDAGHDHDRTGGRWNQHLHRHHPVRADGQQQASCIIQSVKGLDKKNTLGKLRLLLTCELVKSKNTRGICNE